MRRLDEKVIGEVRFFFIGKWGFLSNILGYSGILSRSIGYMFFEFVIFLRSVLLCLFRYYKDFFFIIIKVICFYYRKINK